jgi:hypothetical protein
MPKIQAENSCRKLLRKFAAENLDGKLLRKFAAEICCGKLPRIFTAENLGGHTEFMRLVLCDRTMADVEISAPLKFPRLSKI